MRAFFKILIVLLLLAGGLMIALLAAWNYYNEPPESEVTSSEIFEVVKGDTVFKIAERLEDVGMIRSSYLLVLTSKLEQTQTKIKSGFYRLERTMSTREIHDYLVTGSQELKSVVIPEGWTSSMIGARLEKEKICDSKDFLREAGSKELIEKYGIPAESLEGYLFPDTYRFQQDYPAEKVIDFMVTTFFEKLEKIEPAYRELSGEELHKKIVLASIVEREYRDPEEADKIASVFYNRLEQNMRLQSCATVVYVMTEEKGLPHPKKLTYDDLEVESKFNTYREWGLPPAPIANPGIHALEGTFHPADTDFIYFLLKDTDAGQHIFSRNLSDHNKAYSLYIKQ